MRSHGLAVLDRALRVLEAFSATQPSRSLTVIAAETKLDKAVVFRILQAFVAHRLIEKDPATEEYFITPAIMRWVFAVPSFQRLRALALPRMIRLWELSKETVFLSVISGDDRIGVFQLESPHEVRRTVPLGVRHPIVYGGTGKAALAFMPPERIRRILDRYPLERKAAGTIVVRADLEADLARTRARGYATGVQEEVPNVSAVAAPIFDHSGQVFAILSVTGPLQRFHLDARTRIAPEVVAAARQISLQLGYAEVAVIGGEAGGKHAST